MRNALPYISSQIDYFDRIEDDSSQKSQKEASAPFALKDPIRFDHVSFAYQGTETLVLHDLAQGIDSFIGERGVRLSGGQQQRVAIAHRLSTVEDCDKIIWLDKGRIKMTGPPGDVIPLFTDQGDTRHQCRQALNA